MFERTWTVVCPAATGPSAYVIDSLNLPDYPEPLELEAWRGDGGGGNVFLFEGSLDQPSAAAGEGVLGKEDCLMVAARGAPGCVRIPGDITQKMTVFFDSASPAAQPQTVSIRIRSR